MDSSQERSEEPDTPYQTIESDKNSYGDIDNPYVKLTWGFFDREEVIPENLESLLDIDLDLEPSPLPSSSRAQEELVISIPSDRREGSPVETHVHVSPKSKYSHNSFHTAPSGGTLYYSDVSAVGAKPIHKDALGGLKEEDEYAQILQAKQLWPVDPLIEQNWSGRGQHAEFQKHERKLLSEILQVEKTLGMTSKAMVQSVKCKRILLARKTVLCKTQVTKQEAIDEVAHLHRLRHSHIIQVIGTYVLENELAILMYPVADYDLESFLHEHGSAEDEDEWAQKTFSLATFFTCLLNAVSYIHDKLTKHMDIKPKNILVRDIRRSSISQEGGAYKVYLADFGIARSYNSLEATETDGPTMFTRKYAAPEVVDRDRRGLWADTFSLGCVFLEIKVALQRCEIYANPPSMPFPISLSDVRNAGRAAENTKPSTAGLEQILLSNEFSDTSYQANLGNVRIYVRSSVSNTMEYNFWDRILQMMSAIPSNRPNIEELAHQFGKCVVCEDGPDMLEDWGKYNYRNSPAGARPHLAPTPGCIPHKLQN